MHDVDSAIASINMEECYRRRLVRGRDLNEWHTDLEAWILTGHDDHALALLSEIIDAVETLEQYDDREPHPYWYEKASEIYQSLGSHAEAKEVLERWLIAWPASRKQRGSARLRVQTKVIRLNALVGR